MRLGLLGLGPIGAFRAETLASLPVVEELVVADPVAALAEEAAGRFGAQIADSPQAVLASGVDGVVITGPPTSTPNSSAYASPRPARLLREAGGTRQPVQVTGPVLVPAR